MFILSMKTIIPMIISGILLFYIAKIPHTKRRRCSYLLFVILVPLLWSLSISKDLIILYEQQDFFALYLFGYFNIALVMIAIEAILIAKIIYKYLFGKKLIVFLPLFIIGVWMGAFFTLKFFMILY